MTTTKVNTTERLLNNVVAGITADALDKVGLGTMLTPRKVTFVGLASAAAQDITTAAAAAAATVVPALLSEQLTLGAVLVPIAIRVTAGAAAAGVRTVGDSGATASATVVKLSDDGKTLTFEAAVTAFVIEYLPRPVTDLTAKFA
jgi:hypothetical protein